MIELTLSYTNFKDIVTAKNLLWQYVETAVSYEIFALDGSIKYDTSIRKDFTNTTGFDEQQETDNKTDFETNYKSTANKPLEYRSTDGLPKIASAKFVDSLSFFVDGENGQLGIPSGATAYVKYTSSVTYALAGMDVYWFNANWGDYISCEAGVYPHGDSTNESDFIALDTFGNKYRVYQNGSRIFDILTVKTVPASVNLGSGDVPVYVRITYVNAGGGDAKCIFNIVGWK